MALFNAISNVVFLSLFTYHVISFGIQYLITRRLEFLYYSLYLLCGSVYYFLFFNSALFQANATAATSNV